MAIYIDWAGKKPKGNVTAEGFKDQIEVHSLQWGVGRAISMITGNAANREASQPSFSEFTISKSMDIPKRDCTKENMLTLNTKLKFLKEK